MDPTQFLSDGTTITGLVDSEAYAVAPRELDFIGLEYVLTEKEAHAFKSGYETIMSIPHLEEYRQPYRYLYRLLSVQGNVELKMVKSPILFLNTNEREYTMDIQKKRSVTESEIQQMKDLAYICGQQDNLDYSSDLHINFLKIEMKII